MLRCSQWYCLDITVMTCIHLGAFTLISGMIPTQTFVFTIVFQKGNFPSFLTLKLTSLMEVTKPLLMTYDILN